MKRWWRKRLMRVYYPDARPDELRDLDVRHLITHGVATNAEAIVVNAGGLEALYPSRVPYHHRGDAAERDLLGEIVAEARARGLKIVAGVDFSRARRDVFEAHPAWFQRRADGEVVRDGDYYVTCPLGAYQNEAYAHPVMAEILSTYRLAGFRVNAAGFEGICACASCAADLGEAIPTEPAADPEAWQRFLRWRGQALGRQLTAYYDLLRAIDDAVFLTAASAGPERPAGALKAGQHLPSLSPGVTQVLLATGGAGAARRSRYWAAMAADQARAVRRKRNPLVSIRAQLADTGHPQALKPPGEFAHACYQALAHGAGLEMVTTGVPARQADPRTMPAVAEVLGLVRQQQPVIDTMAPITPVALVWPEEGLRRSAAPDALHDEFVGLYHALVSQHLLLGVLYDEAITPKALQSYQTVVLPGAAWLDGDRAAALAGFVTQGGRLVMVDGPWQPAGGGPAAPPEILAGLVGIADGQATACTDYALPTPQLPPQLLAGLGLLPLTLPHRRVALAPEVAVWLRGEAAGDGGAPADPAGPRREGHPLLAQASVGDGCVAYAAFGLGREYLASGHPDLAALLGAMVLECSPYTPLLLTDAPSSVEVTMAQWEHGVVVHLVNAAGPAPLDRPAPVGPISLDLAWDGPAVAELCAPGAVPQALRCEEAWNRVRLVVPRVDAYAQVVVRSA